MNNKILLTILFFFILFTTINSFAQNTPKTEWQKTFGGKDDDVAYSIQETEDEGYIVAGSTSSLGAEQKDIYIIKLDKNGKKLWEKRYGGKGNDIAYSIRQTKDGGYIVAGELEIPHDEERDFLQTAYLLKLDASGNKIWEKSFGGKGYDSASFIQQVKDGGYIIAGYTSSFGKCGSDFYIIKLF